MRKLNEIEWKKVLEMPAVFAGAVIITLLSLHVIFGCTSASASATEKSPIHGESAAAEQTDSSKAAVTDTVINWKGRGFGEQEPAWLIDACTDNDVLLREKYPAAKGKSVLLIRATGTDLDRTIHIASAYSVAEHHPEVGKPTTLDESWFMIHPAGDKKATDYYVCIKLYTTDWPVSSGQPAQCVVIDAL